MDISDAKRATMALQIINDMDDRIRLMYGKRENDDYENDSDTDPCTNRASAEEMDEKRQENIAYEYLCHLEEAKKWIESCIREELSNTTDLEETLRNGVYLAKLSNFFCPEVVPFKKIYDKDQSKYKSNGLQFRHTDNINHWFNAMEYVGLPKIFFPETTDIYDRKNMPRVIYCLHALSLYLFKLGIAPQIQDLYGVAKFTDEEISTMAKELQKYGLQMPAFSKIGGILANEMPIDEVALHAAILAINDAIEKQSISGVLSKLTIHDAHLTSIVDENAKYYLEVMYDAKVNKSIRAKNKANDVDYVSDVYDELLTQAEIQGLIFKINSIVDSVLELLAEKLFMDISNCINQQDAEQLLKFLKSKISPFKSVVDSNMDWYLAQLTQEKESKLYLSDVNANNVLDRESIQNSINIANKNAEREKNSMKLVETLNSFLSSNKCDDFLNCLQKASNIYLPEIDYDYAHKFYYQEFKSIQVEKSSHLDIDDFVHGIHVLNAIVLINKAIDTNAHTEIMMSIKNKSAHLQDINDTLAECYTRIFTKFKEVKSRKATSLSLLLTYGELQDCITQANYLNNQEIIRLSQLKDSIVNSNHANTFGLLQELNLIEIRLIHNNSFIYHSELSEFLIKNGNLTIENIKTIIENCNNLLYNALNMSKIMILINKINLESSSELLNLIRSKTLDISIRDEFSQSYIIAVTDLRRKYSKCANDLDKNEWFCNKTSDNKYEFYLNLKNSDEFSWVEPIDYTNSSVFITRQILKDEIDNVTRLNERLIVYQQRKSLIVQLQAYIRGFLTRKLLNERLDYLYEQTEAVLVIQSWWRMIRKRHAYLARLDHFKINTQAIVKIQSLFRMLTKRRTYRAKHDYFKQNEAKIIKLQSIVRARQARNHYLTFINEKTPPLSVIRKFVHLLEHNNIDFKEEIEIQQLKRQVITLIKTNKNLEQDLDMMDVKIGLLVKNRITLQDVLMQHKRLKKYKEDIETNQTKYIKQLNKENHDRLELFQNLFYLLQTEPKYLAKLLFLLPPTNSSKFIESVVLELFNYGSNPREEYLLLQLFTHALHEEIESKVDKITEIITGNPLVIKVIVSLYRKYRGENVLRKILHSTIVEFLNDKQIQLCLNPSEIYKSWINRLETVSGKATGYPYDVNVQVALENVEVKKQLEQNIECVKHYTSKFQQLIISNLDKLPYGLRYIAKVLRLALKKKFPDTNEREILKIIGNLVLCRFINTAVCSPDVYDIIDVQVGVPLDIEDRKNLACIGKHLQLIAMSKGYGDAENSHLACLNSYIKESHEQMRLYFNDVCLVQDADAHFGINEFSDLIQLTKPTVYMTIQEICDTHRMLIEHASEIAIERDDVLNDILTLLGPEPNFDSMFSSESTSNSSSCPNKSLPASNSTSESLANKSIISYNTQICLTLTNRFTPSGDESADLYNLFLKTKRFIVDIIQCQSGDDIMYILNSSTNREHEERLRQLLEKRELSDSIAESSIIDSTKILTKTPEASLELMKLEVKQNLIELEASQMVSSENSFQSLLCRIAQDIRNQRKHRVRRQKELVHLKEVAKVLENKKRVLEEQVGYYNEYVKACLDGLNSGKITKSKSKNPFKRSKDTNKKHVSQTVKYTGAKLHEKGVLLEIDGLQQNQLKNVSFEISFGDEPGVFEVQAKFLNLHVEKHEVVFQDLLQMQYEGASIMKLFDKAKVNVNLLIFLLNKKFYGK